MTTRDQERREHEANKAALAEINVKIAHNTGRIEAIIDGLHHDPAIVAEAERLAKKRGVDVAVVMDETIATARAKYLPEPSAPGPAIEPGAVSPEVKRFRELVG